MAPTFLWHKASSLTFKSIWGVFVISLLGFITGCLGDKTDCSETPVTDETTSITATQPVDYIATFETEPPTLVRVMRQIPIGLFATEPSAYNSGIRAMKCIWFLCSTVRR